MKKLLIVLVAVIGLNTNAAVVPHGHMWGKVTSSELDINKAVLGVKADLGAGYTADLSLVGADYCADGFCEQSVGLYSAYINKKGFLSHSDYVSLGLQGKSFASWMVGKVGLLPWKSYYEPMDKSLTYGGQLGETGVEMQVLAGKRFSLMLSHHLNDFGDAAMAAEYDHNTEKWVGKIGWAKSINNFQLGLSLNLADTLGFLASVNYAHNSWLSAYGELGNNGKFAVGPVLTACSNLKVAAMLKQDKSGEEKKVDVHFVASF